VLATIEREIQEARWAFDGSPLETGGWLCSLYAPTEEGVYVVGATGPGPSAEHALGRLRLSHPREIENDLLEAAAALLVGDWHSHPWSWRGDPTDQASSADETAWASRIETLTSQPVWVGLVFTPGSPSHNFHGFVSRTTESGAVVCEQCEVLVAGGL